MSIAFPLTFPSHTGLAGFSIRGHQVVGVTMAPFSGVQQVQEHSGAWWEATLELPRMGRDAAMIWQAWLRSLRGPAGTFLMGIPRQVTPRGSTRVTPGVPQVDGGSQTGLTLAIKTGLGTVAGYLLAGDWFSLGTGSNRRLHQVVGDVNLVAGKATMEIWPRLRATPANNDTVYVSNATGLFRLVEPASEFSIERYDNYTLPPVSCREAL